MLNELHASLFRFTILNIMCFISFHCFRKFFKSYIPRTLLAHNSLSASSVLPPKDMYLAFSFFCSQIKCDKICPIFLDYSSMKNISKWHGTLYPPADLTDGSKNCNFLPPSIKSAGGYCTLLAGLRLRNSKTFSERSHRSKTFSERSHRSEANISNRNYYPH